MRTPMFLEQLAAIDENGGWLFPHLEELTLHLNIHSDLPPIVMYVRARLLSGDASHLRRIVLRHIESKYVDRWSDKVHLQSLVLMVPEVVVNL